LAAWFVQKLAEERISGVKKRLRWEGRSDRLLEKAASQKASDTAWMM
jgi:hypothetical protein